MNERFVTTDCADDGRPSWNRSFTLFLISAKLFNLKSNTKPFFFRYHAARIRLTACAMIVAHAAPAAPIFKGPTSA